MKTTKEMIELMTHYENGGKIEILYPNEGWKDCPKPSWNWRDYDYRIKQKPKYEEGKYYKCWIGISPIPKIRTYSNGIMYDGDSSMKIVEAYEKIEPFELEQKKYGLWVATDKNERQYVYESKPERNRADLEWRSGGIYFRLEKKLFPNQTWEDEPIEI